MQLFSRLRFGIIVWHHLNLCNNKKQNYKRHFFPFFLAYIITSRCFSRSHLFIYSRFVQFQFQQLQIRISGTQAEGKKNIREKENLIVEFRRKKKICWMFRMRSGEGFSLSQMLKIEWIHFRVLVSQKKKVRKKIAA